MKTLKTIAVTGLSLVLLGGCASTSPETKMLEVTANYEGGAAENVDFRSAGDRRNTKIERTQAQTVDVYVFPHEMASGDYFRGGYINTVVREPQWRVENAITPSEPVKGFRDVTTPEEKAKQKKKEEEEKRRLQILHNRSR